MHYNNNKYYHSTVVECGQWATAFALGGLYELNIWKNVLILAEIDNAALKKWNPMYIIALEQHYLYDT